MERSSMLMDWYSKMANLSKAIYRFNEIPIKIPTQFFTDFGRSILSFIWKNRKAKSAETILNNKRTAGGLTVPDFKVYSTGVIIKST